MEGGVEDIEGGDPGVDGREVVDYKAQVIDDGHGSWGMSSATCFHLSW